MSLRSPIIRCLFLFLLPFAFLRAEEEEIRVELSTKKTLTPIYLSGVVGRDAKLPSNHLESLKKILHFDLDYSGYTTIAKTDTALEKVLSNQEPRLAFDSSKWDRVNVDLVLKIEVIENKLDLYAFSPGTSKLKKFEGLQLTGDPKNDRGKMHKLAAAVLKTFFDVEAITNTRILYSIQHEEKHPKESGWKAEIWECDYDGGNLTQASFEDTYSITPVFIPPHPKFGNDRYLFVNYKNGQPKIYYSSIESKTGKPLITLRGNQLLPAISRDRSQIAFISDATGRADLFLQQVSEDGNLIGKPKQLFSYPRSTQASPTFHPDGSKIAFVSDKDGTPRIYMIPISIENNKRAIPILLTRKNRENTCPSWSPDGTKIAYSAKTNGVRQIWIYDFSIREEMQLTTGSGNKENPVWAPDSLHLVFNSTDPDHSELYLVNLNQPEAVKITSGPGKKHYPTWGIR